MSETLKPGQRRVVLITHDMYEALALAHRVIVLSGPRPASLAQIFD